MRRLPGSPRLPRSGIGVFGSGVGVFADQFPETGQLGLQLAGFLFQLQAPADSGQVQSVSSPRAHFLESADVPAGVAAAAARGAGRVE